MHDQIIRRTIITPLYQPRRQQAAGGLLSSRSPLNVVSVSALLAVHVMLGLLLSGVQALSNIHVAIIFVAGFWFALSRPNLERAAYFAAYVTGAETLWRMTNASVFWEVGKYAIVAIFILSMIRNGRLKGPILPLLFLFLLLPSLVMPLANVDGSLLRDHLSFNLSGPVALVASLWFFSQVKLTGAQLQRLFLALICPVISVATIALFKILTAVNLVFIDDSNLATSGGFGPNQVSAVLGLGSLMAFLLVLDRSVSRGPRFIFFVVSLLLVAQSAMTFSRGGLYMACGGAAVSVLLLIQDRRARMRLVIVIAALFIVINFLVFPRLDEFTGGALSKRFSDTRLTGRDNLAMADLKVFADNPLFGVGPGQTRYYRDKDVNYSYAAAHTEFSRLLAEHGVFGLTAIVLLLCMAFQNFRKSPTPRGKALAGSMTVWSLLFMIGAAMRLVAPSFVFGLTAATILPDIDREPGANRHARSAAGARR
jgi:O-antigen ligase